MTQVAVREEMSITPREVLSIAREQAKVLIEVVHEQGLYTEIGRGPTAKKYLLAEAWQTICTFNNAHPVTEWVKAIEHNGETVAWQARVELYKDGQIISSGEMVCGLEEFPCRGKEGFAKERAAQSAAQTWAMAKAARMKFAWVAVLGGYAPTPAEEMIVDPPQAMPPDMEASVKGYTAQGTEDNMCPIHNQEWFQSANMRKMGRPMAHPVASSNTWCTRDEVMEAQEQQEQESNNNTALFPQDNNDPLPEEQSEDLGLF